MIFLYLSYAIYDEVYYVTYSVFNSYLWELDISYKLHMLGIVSSKTVGIAGSSLRCVSMGLDG